MASSIPKPRTSSFGPASLGPITISIPIDSRVVLTKRRSGWVRYIGKLKNEAGEWYGVALDEGKGDCDGTHAKERYFDCPVNHGVFVRRKEIFCVKEYPVARTKEPSSPVTHDDSDAGSSTGSSAESQDIPHPVLLQSPQVAPALPVKTSPAESMIAPLVRTFKSFRKELGLQISPTKSTSASSSSGNNNGSMGTGHPSPSKAPLAAGGRSSGLRSPSSSRFASFSSPKSTASRTASIVSQMLVASIGVSSEAGPASPKSQTEASPTRYPHEGGAQQQKQRKLRSISRQPSIASVGSDTDNDISSLEDLYRVSLTDTDDLSISKPSLQEEEAASGLSPLPHSAPLANASTGTTSSTSSPVTDKPGISLSPARSPPPASSGSPVRTVTRVTSFSSATATTAVESMKPSTVEPPPAPLFFRRANVGSPTLSRRASFTNGGGGSSPTSFSSGKASPTQAAATARIAELEKEISVTRANHENIVAVLRATNKQHAANVLELRAQVAALTEGNHWLEKQLASKSALIAELQAMESSGSRVPRDEVEHIIAIKDSQIQTLEKEIAKLKQHLLRIETEKDSILCQQARHARWRQESDEARIAKLREDVLVMCNERTSLQCELSELKEMTFLF